ncbi:MAG: molybdopterin molybdenumtransferase MoeA, partial [Alphaproteobacteria bacterium]
MISFEQALSEVLALADPPLATEALPLAECAGRVLRADVIARRDQPPFPASAMDGYAMRAADARPGARLRVVGESAAGHRFTGRVGPGEAVRILTGAPLPEGADRVVIQEDVTREGDDIIIGEGLDAGPHVRPAGNDFAAGHRLAAPRRLRPADLALAAAMDAPRLTVSRRPEVAIIATGDELVMPGEDPGPDQIIASNSFGLAAMVEAEGGIARLLPIAPDRPEALAAVLELAADADLVVTSGGASVGDHDLVLPVARRLGLETSFYKVAMRPGKPLMAGRLGDARFLGLPGNPVSAMVCGHLFMRPLLRAMAGLPAAPLPSRRLPLAAPVGPNGPRRHFMRARLEAGPAGTQVRVFERQDSALLSVLAEA